jgi:hypothetical protein
MNKEQIIKIVGGVVIAASGGYIILQVLKRNKAKKTEKEQSIANTTIKPNTNSLNSDKAAVNKQIFGIEKPALQDLLDKLKPAIDTFSGMKFKSNIKDPVILQDLEVQKAKQNVAALTDDRIKFLDMIAQYGQEQIKRDVKAGKYKLTMSDKQYLFNKKGFLL